MRLSVSLARHLNGVGFPFGVGFVSFHFTGNDFLSVGLVDVSHGVGHKLRFAVCGATMGLDLKARFGARR